MIHPVEAQKQNHNVQIRVADQVRANIPPELTGKVEAVGGHEQAAKLAESVQDFHPAYKPQPEGPDMLVHAEPNLQSVAQIENLGNLSAREILFVPREKPKWLQVFLKRLTNKPKKLSLQAA